MIGLAAGDMQRVDEKEEGRSPFDRLKQQPNKPLWPGADWADLGARTTELDCPWHYY